MDKYGNPERHDDILLGNVNTAFVKMIGAWLVLAFVVVTIVGAVLGIVLGG